MRENAINKHAEIQTTPSARNIPDEPCISTGAVEFLTPISWPPKGRFLRLLWYKPATHIARDLNCSQASVLMRAGALGLPRPGHGFWQKRTAGMKLEIPEEVVELMDRLDSEEPAPQSAEEAPVGPRRRCLRRRGPMPAIEWPPDAEFLQMLWSKPATHIARELGCSNQLVHCRANDLGFPTPGIGYWQKKIAGIEVGIPPEVEQLLARLEAGSAG